MVKVLVGYCIALALLLASYVWWEYPWTIERCMTNAAEMPTERGVLLAQRACEDKFNNTHWFTEKP